MANQALNRLAAKSDSLGGLVVALAVGWVVSIPVAIISAMNQDWFWLGVAVFVHTLCSSWFFFWFFYAQMAQLFYMNAAAIVEAVDASSNTTAPTVVSPSDSNQNNERSKTYKTTTKPNWRNIGIDTSTPEGLGRGLDSTCPDCGRRLNAGGKCPAGC